MKAAVTYIKQEVLVAAERSGYAISHIEAGWDAAREEVLVHYQRGGESRMMHVPMQPSEKRRARIYDEFPSGEYFTDGAGI